MNNSYFPDDINLFNFNLIFVFNEQSYVQFLHRNLAYIIITFIAIIGLKFILKQEKKF